jgi:hypothetical protein
VEAGARREAPGRWRRSRQTLSDHQGRHICQVDNFHSGFIGGGQDEDGSAPTSPFPWDRCRAPRSGVHSSCFPTGLSRTPGLQGKAPARRLFGRGSRGFGSLGRLLCARVRASEKSEIRPSFLWRERSRDVDLGEVEGRGIGLEFPYLSERLYSGEIPTVDTLLNLAHLESEGRPYGFGLAPPVRRTE